MSDKKIAQNSGKETNHVGIDSAKVKLLSIDTSLLKVETAGKLAKMKISTEKMKRVLRGAIMINYNFSSYNVGGLVTVNVDKPKEREPETPYFDGFEQTAKQRHEEFEEAKILYIKLRKCNYSRKDVQAFTGWGKGRIDRLARWYDMSGYGD